MVEISHMGDTISQKANFTIVREKGTIRLRNEINEKEEAKDEYHVHFFVLHICPQLIDFQIFINIRNLSLF